VSGEDKNGKLCARGEEKERVSGNCNLLIVKQTLLYN